MFYMHNYYTVSNLYLFDVLSCFDHKYEGLMFAPAPHVGVLLLPPLLRPVQRCLPPPAGLGGVGVCLEEVVALLGGDAGIVHEDVESAEGVSRLLEDRGATFRRGDVTLGISDLSPFAS